MLILLFRKVSIFYFFYLHSLLSKYVSAYTCADTFFVSSILQRATPSLPPKLVSPGRTLGRTQLKCGSLYQFERGSAPTHREFLLFSDCLLWLAPLEFHSWDWDWSWSGISRNSVGITTSNKSEAEISSLKYDDLSPAAESSPVLLQKLDRRKSQQFGVSLRDCCCCSSCCCCEGSLLAHKLVL